MWFHKQKSACTQHRNSHIVLDLMNLLCRHTTSTMLTMSWDLQISAMSLFPAICEFDNSSTMASWETSLDMHFRFLVDVIGYPGIFCFLNAATEINLWPLSTIVLWTIQVQVLADVTFWSFPLSVMPCMNNGGTNVLVPFCDLIYMGILIYLFIFWEREHS